jgi:hypothetical protein
MKSSPQKLACSKAYYYANFDAIAAKAKEKRRRYRELHPLVRKSAEHKRAVQLAGNRRWCAENRERRREIARLSYHRRKAQKTCS